LEGQRFSERTIGAWNAVHPDLVATDGGTTGG
jgi:hypothetical protein